MFDTMPLQIEYLLMLQNFRVLTHGIFDNFFLSITWLGEVIIPVFVMAVIYWGVNKKAGTFVFFTFGLTLYTNVLLKMTACIKRPWMIDSRVTPIEKAMSAADGYSFPSGHTAGAMALWGSIACKWWNKKIIRYSMILIVLLVAFSRNYAGVHTPQDVIVSIAAGIILIFLSGRLLNWIDKKNNRDIVFYLAIVLITIILYLFLHIKCNMQMKHYNPLTDCINPIEMKHSTYSKIGFMLGIFTGWILEKRFLDFYIKNNLKNLKKKIIYILTGLILLYVFCVISTKILLLIFPNHIVSAINSFFIPFYIIFLYPAALITGKTDLYEINNKTM